MWMGIKGLLDEIQEPGDAPWVGWMILLCTLGNKLIIRKLSLHHSVRKMDGALQEMLNVSDGTISFQVNP